MYVQMNSSPVLLALFVCFAYYSQTLSNPVPLPTPGRFSLTFRTASELAVASAGLGYIRLGGPLTEDHLRTARAIVNLHTKPSTLLKVDRIVRWSSNKTFGQLKPGQNAMQLLCENLDEAAKMSRFDVPEFEQLKKNVRLPSPPNDRADQIPAGMSVETFVVKQMAADDPDSFKMMIARGFFEIPQHSATAILELSERDDLESAVDAEFVRARDDYYRQLLTEPTLSPGQIRFTFEDFHKQVNEQFAHNSALKDEYKKLMDQKDTSAVNIRDFVPVVSDTHNTGPIF